MFLTAGYEMINFLMRKGVRLVRCAGWSDYYPNHKGGNEAGRADRGNPVRRRRTGQLERQGPAVAGQELWLCGADTNELRSVQYFNRSPRAFAVATKVFARTSGGRVPGEQLLTNGASLIGQMLKVLIDLRRRAADLDRTPRWRISSSKTAGSSVPASSRDGTPLNIEARKGVLLAAGGFGHNADMRRRTAATNRTKRKWSIANAGDTGEVLQTAMRLGAKTDLLDEAWWLPSVFIANGGAAAASLGSRPAAARRHLRRLDRQAVLQRVELLRRGRQGDVRQQGGAVLDDLRRGLRAQIRHEQRTR